MGLDDGAGEHEPEPEINAAESETGAPRIVRVAPNLLCDSDYTYLQLASPFGVAGRGIHDETALKASCS